MLYPVAMTFSRASPKAVPSRSYTWSWPSGLLRLTRLLSGCPRFLERAITVVFNLRYTGCIYQ